jgi:AraC family transcriptional regulator, dual regulator of chb operon
MYFHDMVPMLRFETEAFGRVFHAAQVVLGPRTPVTDVHGHANFYELMAVLDGRGLHQLRTGTHELHRGDLVLVRPQDQHGLRGLPPDGITFVNVAFPVAAWRTFVDLSGIDPDQRLEKAQRPPTFSLTGLAAGELFASFRKAVTDFQRSPTMFDLLRFWTEVLELPEELAGAVTQNSPPHWLSQACAAMRREENLRGGVPRLAELATVSPAHLARTMRGTYGCTPTEFVADLRLSHAATLLASTTESVTEIAYRCGYASQSYFTRCFRAAHGRSPRSFRQHAMRAFVP